MICIALSLVLYAATPFVRDYLDIVIAGCYYLILACSWNLLAGYTGRFSLAQQTFATIGAYSTGLLIEYKHVPIIVGIAFAALISSLIGFLLGVLVLRMQGSYLALTTWAFAISVQISLTAAYGFTGGDAGLFLPPLLGQVSNNVPYYYIFIALATVAVMTMYFIVESPMGRLMRAIKDDELRAATLGVDTVRWRVLVFVVTSFWSGIAGAFYAHYVLVVSPVMGDFTEMAKVIAMVIVGGLGSFVGPLVGVPLIQGLTAYLQQYGQLDVVIYALIVLVLMRMYRDGAVKLVIAGTERVHAAWMSRARSDSKMGRIEPGDGLDVHSKR